MKLSDIAVLASCVAFALSQPLEKRVLVWETVIEQVVETVEVTSTYYVQPSSSVHKQKYKHKHTKSRSKTTKPRPSATVAPPPPPPVVNKEPPPPPPVVTPEVAPPPPPPVVTPEVAPPPPPATVTPEAPPPPPEVKSETPPPPPPPVITPEAPPPPVVEQEVPPPPPPVVTPAPAAQSPSVAPQEKYEYSYSFDNQVPAPSVTPKAEPVPAASGGGACGEVGGKCSGDLTFYEAGLGACGDTNNGNTEAVFALAHGMMGTQSNGNPYCGRTATITANGKSVVAKLVDKCMGCEGQSVDLSYFAIDQIMDRATGRMYNVEWWFND